MKALRTLPALAVLALSLVAGLYTGSAHATPGTNANTCYETRQVWVEGRWVGGRYGASRWVPGHYATSQVAVPCPPPRYNVQPVAPSTSHPIPARPVHPVHPHPHHPYRPAPAPCPAPPAPAPCPAPIVYPTYSGQSFNGVLNTIGGQTFESSRSAVAQQILSQGWFTSEQVAAILRQFTFESSRLEMAKFAYNRTIDPQNYYVTYNVFTFSSSVTDLANFVSAQPRQW